jgi:hypothetical protein
VRGHDEKAGETTAKHVWPAGLDDSANQGLTPVMAPARTGANRDVMRCERKRRTRHRDTINNSAQPISAAIRKTAIKFNACDSTGGGQKGLISGPTPPAARLQSIVICVSAGSIRSCAARLRLRRLQFWNQIVADADDAAKRFCLSRSNSSAVAIHSVAVQSSSSSNVVAAARSGFKH